MKKLKVLLSNFSDENNLDESILIVYDKYKREKEDSNNSSDRIFEINNKIEKLSDENLKNELSQEEIKIKNNNHKVINILDKISISYLNLYKLLESNNKIFNDILEKIDSEDISLSLKKDKLSNLTKSLLESILIVFSSKLDDENLFSIFQNKHQIQKGYDLLFCKKNKNVPIYYVDSYRIRFGDQGLGKIVPYDKNLEFKNEFYIGGKFLTCETTSEIKNELKKAIKRMNLLQDYINTKYTIAGSIYNNLKILYD